MKRRQAVKRLATLGLAGIVYPGCGRQSLGLLDAAGNIVDGTRDSLTPPACVLTPRQTAGPFYFHTGELRQDISEGRPGVGLRLNLTIVGTDPCAPVQGAAVDIWHADAAGLHSGFDDVVLDPTGGTRADFMRGMQRTDAEGKVEFFTRWPAGIRIEPCMSTSTYSYRRGSRRRRSSIFPKRSMTRSWLWHPMRGEAPEIAATTMIPCCGREICRSFR